MVQESRLDGSRWRGDNRKNKKRRTRLRDSDGSQRFSQTGIYRFDRLPIISRRFEFPVCVELSFTASIANTSSSQISFPEFWLYSQIRRRWWNVSTRTASCTTRRRRRISIKIPESLTPAKRTSKMTMPRNL